MQYDFTAIEQRWQQYWAEHKTFRAPNPGEETFDADRPKYYVLDMFPYPSGVGLHVGHPLGYIATDIVSRYQRMRGYNVLHPMGYDAFGLPAEQYAIDTGVHPRITTEKNIANMTRQLKRLGLSYDWDRSFNTTDPDYYAWTQWIFLQIYNSWFDPKANQARPIKELQRALESEYYYVAPDGELIPTAAEGLDGVEGGPIGAIKWHELSPDEQRDLIDSYRLAYLAEVPVNWCPGLGTVLANEEVTNDGRSERGNYPVYRRPLKQWMLRITAYADRLLEDLDAVDWPEPIKLMQRNWIGKSKGARVDFFLADAHAVTQPDKVDENATGEPELITVFTTRPDTLFGATYMVLAPEHPLVEQITTADQKAAVEAYRKEAAQKADIERQADSKTKTGVFTGSYAINPVTDQKAPIWIADYVLMGYGTGAIMAVPAHDERDFAFAQQFDLPIVPVVMADDEWLKEVAAKNNELNIDPDDAIKLRDAYQANPVRFGEAYTGQGVNINSANAEVSLNGLATAEAKAKIIGWLEDKAYGRGTVQYKLRDWLFSRQRYWGEPFPILHGPNGEVRGVPEDQLPVELPEMEDFKPRAIDDPEAPPEPPLSRAPESWQYVELDGVRYRRELNTMPQWAGSCWYYLRFTDARNDQRLAGRDAERYWMLPGEDARGDGKGLTQAAVGGVDLYVGGAEHAVLHLLYSRFWHKVLYDLGHVSTAEPFGRLFNQGYIQAYYYEDERGVRVEATEVVNQDGKPAYEVQGQVGQAFTHNGQPVTERYGKMGKSLKNAIAPDEVADQYGADTLRLYEMYLGPLDQSKAWSTQDIVGVHRFLLRAWRNFVNTDTGELLVTDDAPSDELRKKLHATIRRVTNAMEALSFNVAIAALIELNNELVAQPKLQREVAEPFVLMLAPMAPHMAEELWHKLGNPTSLVTEPWPTFDADLLVEKEVTYPVQVNGKVKGKIQAPADADQGAIEEIALADEKVKQAIGDTPVRKVIVVPGRMVNIVAK